MTMKPIKTRVWSLKQLQLLLYCICCVHCINVNITANPEAHENLSTINIETGTTVSLKCMVCDGEGGEELQWLRNGRVVRLNDGNRLETSYLCVDPVTRVDNGANFTCQLKANATVKKSIRLIVTYPPNLNGTEDVTFEEKSNSVLSCDIRAYPPVSIIWKKNMEILDLASSAYQATSNGINAELSFTGVKHGEHQGLYSCETNSTKYGLKIKSFNVTVIDKILRFPLGPTMAGLAVIVLTLLLAVISRRQKIMKWFKKSQ